MDYIWIVVVSLAVGIFGNRYVAGAGHSVTVDAAYAVAGGLFAAFLFRTTVISNEVGLSGALVFAGIGAGLLLLARRSFGQI